MAAESERERSRNQERAELEGREPAGQRQLRRARQWKDGNQGECEPQRPAGLDRRRPR